MGLFLLFAPINALVIGSAYHVLSGHELGKGSPPSFGRFIFFELTIAAEIVKGSEMKEIIFTLQLEQK